MIHMRWLPKREDGILVHVEQHAYGQWVEVREDGTIELYGYSRGARNPADVVGKVQVAAGERWGTTFIEVV